MTGTCGDCAYNVYGDEMDEYVCEAIWMNRVHRLMQTGKAVVLPAPATVMNWYATKLRRNPDC